MTPDLAALLASPVLRVACFAELIALGCLHPGWQPRHVLYESNAEAWPTYGVAGNFVSMASLLPLLAAGKL